MPPERILAVGITGGRPALKTRPTSHLLDALADAGHDTAWVIREDHATEYEHDRHPLQTFPLTWANDYASKHWRHPIARFVPDGFHGAFTGREWAMRLGAAGGYDAVLQLDDNVEGMAVINAHRRPYQEAASPVDLLHLMAEFAFATNAAHTGGQLDSVVLHGPQRVIRPGFPYSVFLEKVQPARLPYFGPFEDDIMHALDTALSPSSLTAAVVDVIKYRKHHNDRTGMRAAYNATRGLELARRYPRNVTLKAGPRTSSPNSAETSRALRHYLRTTGFTPIRVLDRDRYAAAATELQRLVDVGTAGQIVNDQLKIRKRAIRPNAIASSEDRTAP